MPRQKTRKSQSNSLNKSDSKRVMRKNCIQAASTQKILDTEADYTSYLINSTVPVISASLSTEDASSRFTRARTQRELTSRCSNRNCIAARSENTPHEYVPMNRTTRVAKVKSACSPRYDCVAEHAEESEQFFKMIHKTVQHAMSKTINDIFAENLRQITAKTNSIAADMEDTKNSFINITNVLGKKIADYGDESLRNFRYLCMKSNYDKTLFQQQQAMAARAAEQCSQLNQQCNSLLNYAPTGPFGGADNLQYKSSGEVIADMGKFYDAKKLSYDCLNPNEGTFFVRPKQSKRRLCGNKKATVLMKANDKSNCNTDATSRAYKRAKRAPASLRGIGCGDA